jgi:hypothetical protein
MPVTEIATGSHLPVPEFGQTGNSSMLDPVTNPVAKMELKSELKLEESERTARAPVFTGNFLRITDEQHAKFLKFFGVLGDLHKHYQEIDFYLEGQPSKRSDTRRHGELVRSWLSKERDKFCRRPKEKVTGAIHAEPGKYAGLG